MSRNFFGGFSSGSGGGKKGGNDGKSGSSSSRGGGVHGVGTGGSNRESILAVNKIMLFEKMTKKKLVKDVDPKKARQEEYMQMMRARLEERKQQKKIEEGKEDEIDLTAGGKYNLTDIEKLSPSAKFMLKKYLEKRKKKEDAKKNFKPRAASLRNGRVDINGNICASNGRVVGFIDEKTGWVCMNSGGKVCKYNGRFPGMAYGQIERMIDEAVGVQQQYKPFAWAYEDEHKW